MNFVDVILPLPLDGLFTYSVPGLMRDRVKPGMRLLVPLGRSKTYTGIAMRLHDTKPDFEVKEVMEVLDSTSVLLPQQLKLWQWISDYYLSPIGDVYKAALPSGLKAEEGFRPKTETYVALSESCRNEQTLHACLNMLARATKQLQTFTTFLSLSHWDSLSGTVPDRPIIEVTREELMNASHCTAAVMKALIDRRFLFTYEKTVGRLNVGGEPQLESIQPLSQPQQDAYNQIVFQFLKKPVVLFHGVTSSGKTEVYIHLIKKALDEHQQVLYLLPEIALTIQITTRLQRILSQQVQRCRAGGDMEQAAVGHSLRHHSGRTQRRVSAFPQLGTRAYRRRTRNIFQTTRPRTPLSCPKRGHYVGPNVWRQDAVGHRHAVDGKLLQRSAGQVRPC